MVQPLRMRMLPSDVIPGHPDFDALAKIRDGIVNLAGGSGHVHQAFPVAIRDAIDFVLDPVRTGRTELHQLDNVEKTFVGLKIEHYVRDFLGAPKGVRDLVINGKDVDIKNTLDNSWMIPPETYAHEDPCLVITSKEEESTCWMGVMLARQAYLNAPNRDGKRGVKSGAVRHILWLVEGAPYPPSVWRDFDMGQFNRLRKVQPGTARAVKFFSANIDKVVPREVVQALLFDQLDPLKQLRKNQGARGVLEPKGIALLSGSFGRKVLRALGRPEIPNDAFLAIVPKDEHERRILITLGAISG